MVAAAGWRRACCYFCPANRTALFLAIAAGAAVVLPVLDFLLLLIPNAAVLLFPSWIQTGKDSPRGIEATGQRLIFAVGQLLVPAAGARARRARVRRRFLCSLNLRSARPPPCRSPRWRRRLCWQWKPASA